MKRTLFLLLCCVGLLSCTDLTTDGDKQKGDPDIPLVPVIGTYKDVMSEVFDCLDLDYPGLENVKQEYASGNIDAAAYYLLEYWRNRTNVVYPGSDLINTTITASEKRIADQTLEYRYYVKYEGVESVDEATGEETYWSLKGEDGDIDWGFLPSGV